MTGGAHINVSGPNAAGNTRIQLNLTTDAEGVIVLDDSVGTVIPNQTSAGANGDVDYLIKGTSTAANLAT